MLQDFRREEGESWSPEGKLGLGVSIVPRSTSRIRAEGVFYLPIEGDAPRAEICLAYRRDERSPAVQNFVAVARRVMQTEAQSKSNGDSKEVGKARVPRH